MSGLGSGDGHLSVRSVSLIILLCYPLVVDNPIIGRCIGVLRRGRSVPLTVVSLPSCATDLDRQVREVSSAKRVQASEQIQAIIRLKHIHESGPHYIFPIIPRCPPSVIPEITVVPQGTSPHILLTIWFLHCDHPVRPEYSGCGPGYR